jgi:hypothetical protein
MSASKPIRIRRRARVNLLGGAFLFLLAAGFPAVAQDAPADDDRPPSGTLNLDNLLMDPVVPGGPHDTLRRHRAWLAHQNGDPAAFEKVADEFEKIGAYYPAIELLWFAEKIVPDTARRDAFTERMRALQAKHRQGADRVDAAVQVWAAEGPVKAMDMLRRIAEEEPYNEIAHYEIGKRTWLMYLAMEGDGSTPVPARDRLQLFRDCYVANMITLNIDPLYNDAYYQLNQLRAMLADVDRAFLERTEPFSRRALAFLSNAVPALSALDEGGRTPEALAAAAAALAEVDQFPYAVYAYQAAIANAAANPELAAAIREKTDAILKDKLPLP